LIGLNSAEVQSRLARMYSWAGLERRSSRRRYPCGGGNSTRCPVIDAWIPAAPRSQPRYKPILQLAAAPSVDDHRARPRRFL